MEREDETAASHAQKEVPPHSEDGGIERQKREKRRIVSIFASMHVVRGRLGRLGQIPNPYTLFSVFSLSFILMRTLNLR